MKRIPLDTKYFKANRYKQLLLASYSIKFFNYCLFNHFTINFTYLLLSKQNNKKRVQTNIKRVILSDHRLLSIKNQFFKCSNPFTNISPGYLNLWDIFSFIFRQLGMNFFHKIMVREKIFFLQMHNSFAKSKIISKYKNDKP